MILISIKLENGIKNCCPIVVFYLVLSLVVRGFQTLTNFISRNLNDGHLNTEHQAIMTPTYMGVIVIINFVILTVLLIYFAFYSNKWYYAFGVLSFPFIPPFLELFVPILSNKIMLNIIKRTLHKNSLKNILYMSEYFKIINFVDKLIENEDVNKKNRL